MLSTRSARRLAWLVPPILVTGLVLALAPLTLGGNDPWQAVKAATARYHSIEQATSAGYSTAGEPCVASPAGAMGIHAVNQSLVMDPPIDPLQPEILVYLPKENNRLELVGVEYFAVALANTEDGPVPWFHPEEPPGGFVNPAPTLFGQTFDGPMAGHNPHMPWHYDLHVWLWEDNPAGLFAMFNPAISC